LARFGLTTVKRLDDPIRKWDSPFVNSIGKIERRIPINAPYHNLPETFSQGLFSLLNDVEALGIDPQELFAYCCFQWFETTFKPPKRLPGNEAWEK
jgi:hypothetical protein